MPFSYQEIFSPTFSADPAAVQPCVRHKQYQCQQQITVSNFHVINRVGEVQNVCHKQYQGLTAWAAHPHSNLGAIDSILLLSVHLSIRRRRQSVVKKMWPMRQY